MLDYYNVYGQKLSKVSTQLNIFVVRLYIELLLLKTQSGNDAILN